MISSPYAVFRSNHQQNNMTTTKVSTFDILGHEFELDQLNDIAKHGMSGGVSGFIYSTELADIFNKNEDEIFEVLDEHADELGEKSGMQLVIDYVDDFYTMQDIKEKAVWMFAEVRAVQILQRNEHPDWS